MGSRARRSHSPAPAPAPAPPAEPPALRTPSCFDGQVRGISADDDEMIAIGPHRQVFTMDGALGDPRFFNWTVRWGPTFWTGPGRTLPGGITWSWSVSSPREDGTFTDP